MNKRSLYIIIVFILIPLYIFGDSTSIFFKNMNKITYSLEMPVNRSNVTKNDKFEIPEVPKMQEKQTVRQLWVILINESNQEETSKTFKDLGIKNLISIKIDKNKTDVKAIGPFLDKSIAIRLQKKIENYNDNLKLSLYEIVE